MKRRSTRMRRSAPKERKDWVYRHSTQGGDDTFVADGLGTYENTNNLVVPGQANAVGNVLVDAAAYLRNVTKVAGTTQGLLGGEARPYGRKMNLHAVQGFLHCTPSNWAVGSRIEFAWAIMVGEQEVGFGGIILDLDFTLWDETFAGAGRGNYAAMWVNQTRCLAVGRAMRVFSTSNDQAAFNMRVAWRGRWKLRDEDGLFLVTEASAQSVTLNFRPFCRTLVSGGRE